MNNRQKMVSRQNRRHAAKIKRKEAAKFHKWRLTVQDAGLHVLKTPQGFYAVTEEQLAKIMEEEDAAAAKLATIAENIDPGEVIHMDEVIL